MSQDGNDGNSKAVRRRKRIVRFGVAGRKNEPKRVRMTYEFPGIPWVLSNYWIIAVFNTKPHYCALGGRGGPLRGPATESSKSTVPSKLSEPNGLTASEPSPNCLRDHTYSGKYSVIQYKQVIHSVRAGYGLGTVTSFRFR